MNFTTDPTKVVEYITGNLGLQVDVDSCIAGMNYVKFKLLPLPNGKSVVGHLDNHPRSPTEEQMESGNENDLVDKLVPGQAWKTDDGIWCGYWYENPYGEYSSEVLVTGEAGIQWITIHLTIL